MALVALTFNFIQNNSAMMTILLFCYGDSCHISVHLKKRIKIGEFLCSHFNIECGRKYATFSAYYALLFQER